MMPKASHICSNLVKNGLFDPEGVVQRGITVVLTGSTTGVAMSKAQLTKWSIIVEPQCVVAYSEAQRIAPLQSSKVNLCVANGLWASHIIS